VTRAQVTALTAIAAAQDAGHPLHVGRDPGAPWSGSGYATRTLTALIAQGLIWRDAYAPGLGRTLALTNKGRDALPATPIGDSQ
jgi:hypothetical protein